MLGSVVTDQITKYLLSFDWMLFVAAGGLQVVRSWRGNRCMHQKITEYLHTELISSAEKPRTKLTEKKRCFQESVQSNEIICQSMAEFSRLSRELHQHFGRGKLTLACQSCAVLDEVLEFWRLCYFH